MFQSRKQIRVQIRTAYGVHWVILKPDEKGLIAVAPDLPGVISWGRNSEEAKKMIKEAIELCIECLAEENIKNRNVKKTSRELTRAEV